MVEEKVTSLLGIWEKDMNILPLHETKEESQWKH